MPMIIRDPVEDLPKVSKCALAIIQKGVGKGGEKLVAYFPSERIAKAYFARAYNPEKMMSACARTSIFCDNKRGVGYSFKNKTKAPLFF